MAEKRKFIRCQLCEALNPADASTCKECGMMLVPPSEREKKRPPRRAEAPKEGEEKKDEIDELLENLLDGESKDKEKFMEDLVADELLDSLLLDEGEEGPEPPEEEEILGFECPICGFGIPEDATRCPSCEAEFVGEEEGEEVSSELDELEKELQEVTSIGAEDFEEAEELEIPGEAEEEEVPEREPVEEGIIEPEEAPEAEEREETGETEEIPAELEPPRPKARPRARVKPVEEFEEEYTPVEIPEDLDIDLADVELPKLHLIGGKYVDFIIMGTVLALVLVFLLFKMYYFNNVTFLSMGTMIMIAVAGMVSTGIIFRLSASDIAAGDRALKAGDYEEAIEFYNKAIRLQMKPAHAWTNKGVAYKRVKNYPEALRCHNIALKLNPKNEVAWANRGDVLFRIRRMKEAISSYDEAISVNPKYVIAWNNKGTALAKLGKFNESLECLDKATKIKPRYLAAWLNKGEVLARLGYGDEAERSYWVARKLTAARS